MTPSHRPRRKRKASQLVSASSNGTVLLDAPTQREKPAFPLAAFFWPIKGTPVSQWVILPLILMATGLFRWVTGFWQYSGYQMPPMHGDFEAQRHWMELTVHLPVTHWYYHDLQWWGLDYPPLTAYHSWILGMIGTYIQPDWFALYLSRRSDDPGLKVFMRATVILSEFAIFIPAAVLCIRQLARLHNINSWESAIALTALLMQPATILIDHGHFQYNTVMLGFQLASIASMLAGRRLWSCVFFVCALGFKQMALFYAPAVAAYLAGSCLFPRINIARFIGMAIVTLASFAALFLPIILGTGFDVYRSIQLPTDAQTPPLLAALPFDVPASAWYRPYLVQLLQAIHRIFPFARGLFEDKVANIWCAIHASGLHKLTAYDQSLLSRASLLLTLAATAWAFFLCGFQVHEKNVLLPLLPMTLLLGTAEGMKPAIRAWVGYANLLACFTMFPLLTRDGLRIPYAVLTLLWAYLLALPPISLTAYTASASEGGPHWTSKLIHLGTYAAMLGWHGVVAFKEPPQDKPDLWVVANVLVGAAGFGCCYLWCLWRLVADSGAPSAFERRAREVERKRQ
jgi:alpha-1,3-glucosyltransferase